MLDGEALRHNLKVVRAQSSAQIMAVIKANGYGHGLCWSARNLPEADGFGVASLEEGLALRAAGIDRDICLLEGFFSAEEIPLIIQERLAPVIHEHHQIAALQRYAGPGAFDAWIKIDTGMHRLGFAPDEVRAAQAALEALPVIRRIGLMSHLASAETRACPETTHQIATFRTLAETAPRSLANSAGILLWPQSHHEWVRPGLMLFGASPLPDADGPTLGLRPVMTLKSRLISIRRRHAGDAIGYGGAYRCPEDMPVGVVGIGYGDGYPREFRRPPSVLISGRRAPVVGRVSMDMVTVDLRSIPEPDIGDEVILWGEGLPVEEVADAAGTVPYTLLCGLTQRLPRWPAA